MSTKPDNRGRHHSPRTGRPLLNDTAPDLVTRAVAMHAAGMPLREIALELNISQSSCAVSIIRHQHRDTMRRKAKHQHLLDWRAEVKAFAVEEAATWAAQGFCEVDPKDQRDRASRRLHQLGIPHAAREQILAEQGYALH